VSEPRRAELWWVDWSPGRGSEQTGLRPALVVQTDAASSNPRYPNVVVVGVSTKGRPVPFHVVLPPDPTTGLDRESFAKCEQIMTISKDRLVRHIGRVGPETMEKVAIALRLVLDL
jgi:mRNA interferase MazF